MGEHKKTATEILQDNVDRFNKVISKINYPEVPQFNYNFDEIVSKIEIDPESTFEYQAQQLINQIIDKSDEQIVLLKRQNEQLSNNYQKLEDLYKIKEQELSDAKQEALEAKEEAKKLRREKVFSYIFNFVTLVIAVLAWLYPRG